jgi:hypothetical protein
MRWAYSGQLETSLHGTLRLGTKGQLRLSAARECRPQPCCRCGELVEAQSAWRARGILVLHSPLPFSVRTIEQTGIELTSQPSVSFLGTPAWGRSKVVAQRVSAGSTAGWPVGAGLVLYRQLPKIRSISPTFLKVR